MASPDADGEAEESKRQIHTASAGLPCANERNRTNRSAGAASVPAHITSIEDLQRASTAILEKHLQQLDEITSEPEYRNRFLHTDEDELEITLPKERNIGEYDTDELMAIIREVFSAGAPLSQERACVEIACASGFKRTGKRIREEIQRALRTAIKRHIIYREKGVYGIECRTIEHYSRDELIQTLLASIGSTWWERPDSIRAAARRLGFRRTGRRITDAFRSAINGAIRRGLLEADTKSVRKVRS